MYPKRPHLDGFNSISLDDLENVSLLNRQDTKFVFHKSKLPLLLDSIKSSYRVLSIEGLNEFSYENTYFDTDDYLFYNQHHNEERNRYKVRFRKYSPSDDFYFEIKLKNNKDRTIKKRLKREGSDTLNNHIFIKPESELVSDIIGISAETLSPKLSIQFSRITLADNSFTERLTIDTGLRVKNKKDSVSFDWLVISEVKQMKYNPKSNYIKTLRSLKIPEMRFSKYCIGMVNIYNHIKYNRFKPKLLQIDKILTQTQL